MRDNKLEGLLAKVPNSCSINLRTVSTPIMGGTDVHHVLDLRDGDRTIELSAPQEYGVEEKLLRQALILLGIDLSEDEDG